MEAIRILIDADAFNHLRSLGFTSRFAGARVKILLTQYVARKELCQLSADIQSLESSGTITVMPVSARDETFKRLRQDGVDKGEAESIAWALSLPRSERPIFISCDKGARKNAEKNGVPCGDILDLLISLIDRGIMREEDVRELLLPWDDKRQQRGRPADFSSFDATVKQRRAHRPAGAIIQGKKP
jgi:predicted nucleic acid-binding protein